jgi:opacity protein-like surface antigen
MANVKQLAVAGSALMLSLGAASAADLRLPPPPLPAPVEFSGWYLRGDLGLTSQFVKGAHYGFPTAPIAVRDVSKEFGTGGMFGLGFGYQFNSWLRTDFTGEYRSPATFRHYEIVTVAGPQVLPEHNTVTKTEWVALANLYADLGTWWCVTPFIGAGVGFANVRLSGFEDITGVVNAHNHAAAGSKWNFAYAAHAGLAYKVTPGLSLELAYRYLYTGDGVTGAVYGYDNTYQGSGYTLKGIGSHDVKFGMRWMLMAPEPAYAPLVRKG